MLPDEATRRWIFDAWAWLLARYGGFEHFMAERPLVTPTVDNFPVEDLEGHDLACDYFGFVCEHLGLRNGTFETVPDSALQIWEEYDPRKTLVPYDPDSLRAPIELVSQMANGLVFRIIAAHQGTPALDDEEFDCLVDVATVFWGFGLFSTSVAARGPEPRAFQISSSRLGERELAYSLGIFAWLLEISDREVLRFLAPNPAAYYRAAVKELRKRPRDIRRLRGAMRPTLGPYR